MNQFFRIILLYVVVVSSSNLLSSNSSEIYVGLQKLHSLKRVLYVAAHPDDENTRALAWLSLGEHAETAYFSFTRGDGGQNLIGNELGDRLGVLRTQELLAARSYDKANQYFSRAVDFGYSKTTKETLKKWGHDKVLSDLVRMIRVFKPDVIITRFPPDERAGHGHHSASCELALEAFEKAADKDFLPLQVKEFGVWQTTSMYWNTSSWWVKGLEDSIKNNSDYLVQDIGGFNEVLGMSYNEIGTIARSQHKCQGFGAILERGSALEYFKHLKGKILNSGFFEDNKMSWKDIVSFEFEAKLNSLLTHFDFKNPSNNVNQLLEILKGLETLPSSFFKEEKVKRCKDLIIQCCGLHIDLLGKDYSYTKGDSITFELNVLNRSNINVIINKMEMMNGEVVNINQILEPNKPNSTSIAIQNNVSLSIPYWLEENHDNLFQVKDEQHLLLAKTPASFNGIIHLQLNGVEFDYPIKGIYKWKDPSFGERSREIISVPPFNIKLKEELVVSKPLETKNITCKIHAYKDFLIDTLHIKVPENWSSNKLVIPFKMDKKNGEMDVEFTLTPLKEAKKGELYFTDSKGNVVYTITEIAYDHIETQTIIEKEKLSCIPLNVKIKKGKVAYIKGVEDEVPLAIKQLGFEVDQFNVEELSGISLNQYQSVVLGIRIYNVKPELINFDQKLFDYVKQGGNLVMQYNTASRWEEKPSFGPKPFKISRDRVTEEDAKVTFLDPTSKILNYPNKITNEDFEGWIQERGLYFAEDWDSTYTPILSWADEGEEPQKGGLIALQYGKGRFIYTGISFFRELPNGVQGAYKLFANLLSYEP